MSSGPASAGSQVFTASAGDAGRRVDAFLADRLRISRAAARRLLARGVVRLDGRAADLRAKGRALAPGARIEVTSFTPPARIAPQPEPEAELRVLARGEGWLAVDKPAGVPVHPLSEGERGTLLGAVVARHPEIVGVGEGGLRSGVVHRLDVGTSGVVLFATAEPAWRRLRAAFAAHRVEKRYRAIVAGALAGEGRCEVGLEIARHRPARVRVVDAGRARDDKGVRVATLAWRALESLAGATLIEVALETGFLHQIRATFAARGHPVLGDPVYGAPDRPGGASQPARQMLHAAALRVDEVVAESPDPPDFAAALAALRRDAPAC